VTGWNFADVWEAIAEEIPDAPAQGRGTNRTTWADFDRRADGLARTLLDAGAQQQDKVALYVYNGPEYLEACFGAWKAGLVPFNTNYRYTEDELVYLWDNADAVAVVFHGTFVPTIEAIRAKVPEVRTWLWVDDGSEPCPDWATPYEGAAAASTERVTAPWGRSGEDLLMLYTGGTTGMPKGVMWRQHDLFLALNRSAPTHFGTEPDLEKVHELIGGPGPVGLPACPLMHGTGWFNSLIVLNAGGSIVTVEGRSFDVVELLDCIEHEGVNVAAIVGDAFAKPMLRALDADPDRWDISSLVMLSSSGVMWSEATKQGLLRHHPNMLLVDAFSSSEALGMGQSVSGGGAAAKTAQFVLGDDARVIDDDDHDIEPGSGAVGRVAVKGVTPVGYYKDEAKSQATFLELDGERYSIPGDYATVEADGSLTLLGRGSVCINTGGEKVFPEEVEEALKEHDAVLDAVAVGVPDDKFGEAITAVVEPAPGAVVDEAELIGHVKTRLAAYKAPKRVVVVETIGRAPNGKVDYKRIKTDAMASLEGAPPA